MATAQTMKAKEDTRGRMVMEVRALQSRKASFSTRLNLCETERDVRPLQLANALLSITAILSGSVREVSPTHPWKVFEGMQVKLLGMETNCSPLQFMNALGDFIQVTPSGRVRELSLTQFSKAR